MTLSIEIHLCYVYQEMKTCYHRLAGAVLTLACCHQQAIR